MLQVLAEVHRPPLELLPVHSCQVSVRCCLIYQPRAQWGLPIATAYMPCQSGSLGILSRMHGS